jgi:hypothetical protein
MQLAHAERQHTLLQGCAPTKKQQLCAAWLVSSNMDLLLGWVPTPVGELVPPKKSQNAHKQLAAQGF